MLGDGYKSYGNALKCLSRTTLCTRTSEINLKFEGKKYLKSEKYQNWFCEYSVSDQASKTWSVKECWSVDASSSQNKWIYKVPNFLPDKTV